MTRPQVRLVGLVIGLAFVILGCGDDGDPRGETGAAESSGGEETARSPRLGGMGTAFDDSSQAFSLTARNINHYERQVFADGKTVFEIAWTPNAGDDFGGAGPGFDATACATCHADDGRSAGPYGDGVLPEGMAVGLRTDDPATVNHYGASLSANGIDGVAEAVVAVTYEEIAGTFDDGTPYSLRRPVYTVDAVVGAPLPDDAVVGVRVAPQLPGMGLLELIPDGDLVSRADPEDLDGDGISGRLGVATDLLDDTPAIGRFGWTASQPTVEQQTATALFRDMGLTSTYFPSPDCDRWAPCLREGVPLSTEYNVEDYGDPSSGIVITTGDTEVSDQRLLELTVYTQTLAVPAARDLDDPVVQRGEDVFEATGCSSCHAGGYTTRSGPIQGLSNQPIHPYTDLLVHDLGPGLGDQTIGGDPVAMEWRTPPLWGIGLLDTVNGHTDLLHDGRARGYEEAILWHDGEAAASAATYRSLSADDREALVRFLASL